MKRAVLGLKERKGEDVEFLCLSNSNEVYISTILEVSVDVPLAALLQDHTPFDI